MPIYGRARGGPRGALVIVGIMVAALVVAWLTQSLLAVIVTMVGAILLILLT